MKHSNKGRDGAASWSHFDEDDGYYKDVYGDLSPGESPETHLLRHVFAHAGYEVKQIEKSSSHPVTVVRAIFGKEPRVTDHRQLVRNLRNLLGEAGHRLKSDELSVAVTRKRILIAFQNGEPPANWEKILSEPQEDSNDYADIPL